MATDKVKQMLRSKGAPFNESDLESISDGEGWRWIYSNGFGKATAKKDVRAEVCLTGFSPSEKESFVILAESSGLKVASVTKNLTYLIAGTNAGPAKLKQATEQGVTVLTPEQFHTICLGSAGTSATT